MFVLVACERFVTGISLSATNAYLVFDVSVMTYLLRLYKWYMLDVHVCARSAVLKYAGEAGNGRGWGLGSSACGGG